MIITIFIVYMLVTHNPPITLNSNLETCLWMSHVLFNLTYKLRIKTGRDLVFGIKLNTETLGIPGILELVSG